MFWLSLSDQRRSAQGTGERQPRASLVSAAGSLDRWASIGDLADNPVVGRIHQVYDLRSMGSDELAVDVGAIKSSYRSRGFFLVHLCHPL